jgi:uncharacterized damage-inducible protein DinB
MEQVCLSTLAAEYELRIIKESVFRINRCLDLLNEEQVAFRMNGQCNSVGNLILHLCGNVYQYIQTTLGNKPDIRNRNLEFEHPGPFVKHELKKLLHEITHESNEMVQELKTVDWFDVKHVQCFDMSGIQIVIHVMEHFSYHTGQIALLTKIYTQKDLGFYSGMAL